MATNELAGALQDVRKMKRSLRLRKEQDPEVVAETLTTVLREALAVRSASGGRLGRGAVNELKNIRQSMVAGQIDPGQRSAEFIGKYSAILDQIGNVEKESREEAAKEGGGVGQSIAANLPSADMITSALITANPILGYTTKIVKDVFSSSNKRRKAQREQEQKRLQLLEKEEQKLEEETKDIDPDTSSPQENEMLAKLDMIRDEIHKLILIWSDGDEKLERIVSSNADSNELQQDSTEKLERIIEQETESNRLERQNDSRSDLMASERSYEKSSFGAGSIHAEASETAEDALSAEFDGRQGLFAGLGGAIGGMASALATKMMMPFVGLINFIKRGGSILGRLGRVSGLITAAYAIYDFVDGFMSAEDILDKKSSEISITDKIRAGASSVVAGLLAPVDWILDFMDMGFMEDKESFTKKIANSESELIQFFLSPGSWIIDYVRNFEWEETYNKIKESIGGAVEAIGEKFSEIGKAIEQWIDEKIEWFNDTWIGQQIKSIVDSLSNENQMTDAIEDSGGYYRGNMGDAEELNRRQQLNESPNITSDALSAALSVVDREVMSGGKGSSPTIVAPNNSSSNVINNNTIKSDSGAEDQDRTWRRSGMSGGFMAW